MFSRRNFLGGAGAITAAVSAASVGKAAMAALTLAICERASASSSKTPISMPL